MSDPKIADDRNRAHWLARADRLRLPVNILWWLRTALPGAVAVHAGLAAGLLVTRRAHIHPAYLVSGYAVAMLGVAAVASWRARRRFLDRNDALLRLENHLGLHNRLSAALAGHADWPAPVRSERAPYAFHARAWLIPLALLAGLPVVAAFAPMPAPSKPPAAIAVAEPPEWKEMEQWAEKLKEADTAEAEAIKRIEERIEALRQENRDGMFRQGAQEATEALHAEMKNNISKLAQGLAKTGELAAALEQLAAAGRESAPAELSAEWKDALEKLAKAPLPPGAPNLADLKAIDPSKLKQLDPKKFKVVKAKLSSACKNCGECGMDPDKVAAMLAKCEGMGMGLPEPWREKKSGSGGPGGGGGPGDLNFTNDADPLAPKVESLPGAKENESVEAGDLLSVSNRKPDADAKKDFATAKGGDSAFTGRGGDAVWRDRLTPEEVEFLSKYNKPEEKK
jgi:hypothetical protein